jgi:hypothetical protein
VPQQAREMPSTLRPRNGIFLSHVRLESCQSQPP